jgi:hypothetical protein
LSPLNGSIREKSGAKREAVKAPPVCTNPSVADTAAAAPSTGALSETQSQAAPAVSARPLTIAARSAAPAPMVSARNNAGKSASTTRKPTL